MRIITNQNEDDIHIEKVQHIFKRFMIDTLIIDNIRPKFSMKWFVAQNRPLSIFYNMYNNGFTVPKFNRFDERDNFYRFWCDFVKVPSEFKSIWEQYEYVEGLPQPIQKSLEWFTMRANFITASAGAQAIGESKYDPPLELIKAKIGLGKKFEENFNFHHGKKLESIATLIYEYIYNVKVGEFGLVPHIAKPQISYLGASPDGICTCSTLDGQFSNLIGRMLEIKCVTSRQINITGKEDGEITPHYYWIQVQLQLECCDLEDCDFWQCKLKNYWSERLLNEAIQALDGTMHTREQGEHYTINPQLEVGTMIELMPNNAELKGKEKDVYYAAYIYPTELDCSMKEKIDWANNMKYNWKTHYPEFAEDYHFGKILYYHLEKSHCYLIKRDRTWFKNTLPKFKAFWDEVLSYRNDPVKKNELIEQMAIKEAKRLEKVAEKEEMMRERHRNSHLLMDVDSD